jgi:hypothetical protein
MSRNVPTVAISALIASKYFLPSSSTSSLTINQIPKPYRRAFVVLTRHFETKEKFQIGEPVGDLVQGQDEDPEEFLRRQADQKAFNEEGLRARKKALQSWGKACDAYITRQKNSGSNVKLQTTEQIGLALLDRESPPSSFRSTSANHPRSRQNQPHHEADAGCHALRGKPFMSSIRDYG